MAKAPISHTKTNVVGPKLKKRKRTTATPWYEGSRKRRTGPRTSANRATHRPDPSITSSNPSKTGFADLPGELRNKIYELALVNSSGKPIRITSGMDTMGRALGLGVLGICKAVRKEALGYFYDSNTFRIDAILLPPNTRREGPLDYFTDCYDSRLKAYEAPLRNFINGARSTTSLNRTHGLKSIRRLTFAYFHVEPAASSPVGTQPLLPDTADLVITWALQPRAPYYTLVADQSRSTETDLGIIIEVMERLTSTIQNMVELRDVRKFAAKDVMEIADRFYYCCMNMKVGEK